MTDFVAGWMGGVAVLLVGHPFDTIKVRQQSIRAASGSAGEVGSRAAMEMGFRMGVRSFYKGICAPMCAVGFANAALFGTYSTIINFFIRSDLEQLCFNDNYSVVVNCADNAMWGDGSAGNSYHKQDLSEHFRTGGKLTAFENFIASTCGGIAYATLMNPFEVVKVRLQTEHLFRCRRYLGNVHCMRRLYAEGGIKSFFKGYSATLIRDIPGAGVYLFSYSTFTQILGGDKNYNIPRILLAGGCAGVAQWVMIFPLDTIKTRMQIASKEEALSWTRCARKLYNHHGFMGLYAGIFPALVRAFAANGAAFVGVEATLKFFSSTGLEYGKVS